VRYIAMQFHIES